MARMTPIMGWASWNCFRTDINEEKLKAQADALVETGLAGAGYTYLNIDDGFFGGRAEDGTLLFHRERFPRGIKPVADYAHALGLRAGIYTDAGDNTCGHYYDREGANGAGVGLYGHEERDLRLYLEELGFDFIKVDWCGGLRLCLDEREQYSLIGQIIDDIRRETGREIVYNICRWQFPGSWAAQAADSWRIGCDIGPDFRSVLHQIDLAKPLRRFCRPGHVNDLDMMELGNGLTPAEERAHFALWCMMSAPLIVGCDLTKLSGDTLSILKNRELIAVDQDPLCRQACVTREVRDGGRLLGEVWVKELEAEDAGVRAAALLNRGDEPLELELTPAILGLDEITEVRDLWAHKPVTGPLRFTVAPHDALVFRVAGTGASELRDVNAGLAYGTDWPGPVWIGREETEAALAAGAALVDVRATEEFARGHLPGAVNLPWDGIHFTVTPAFPDKTTPLVLICATGKRSAQASFTLHNMGYKQVKCAQGVLPF